MVEKKIQAKKKQAGFTLVEVMVTMTIIAIMGTIVVINVLPRMNQARSDKAKIDIARLSQALEYYNLDTSTYPENLDALVSEQSGGSTSGDARANPEGYIKILPDDPWGNAYLYAYPGENGRFDIWSYGADGEEGGEGNDADITNWKK